MSSERRSASNPSQQSSRPSDPSQGRPPSSSRDPTRSSRDPNKAPSAPQKTLEELQNDIHKKFVSSCIKSHAGWLGTISTPLSSSLTLPEEQLYAVFAFIFLFLHLISPTIFLPHISASVTLLIPLQNTLISLSNEILGPAGKFEAQNSSQWMIFWTWYTLFSGLRGWVSIFKPGWKGWFEIGRSSWLVILGGPWFGRAWLRPTEPTKAEKDAEKAAQTETDKREKEEKDKEDKSKKDKGDKEDEKKKEQERKAREASKDPDKEKRDREKAKARTS